ncbi:hypothetical protein EKG40_11095 [Pseudomonas moorei]|nr:hypothetical protein EKG40_11095 [Pseudomonas moorei]
MRFIDLIPAPCWLLAVGCWLLAVGYGPAANRWTLVMVWSLAVFIAPSGSEMAKLLANFIGLERRSGKFKLSSGEKRLLTWGSHQVDQVMYGLRYDSV